MKLGTKQFWMMTAGLALAAAGVGAQTPVMRANVPFEFEAGGQHMAAGIYEIRSASDRLAGAPILKMTNSATGKVAVVMALTPVGVKGGQATELQFACANGQCVVARIYEGGSNAWAFAPERRSKGSEPVYQASVPLERATAR